MKTWELIEQLQGRDPSGEVSVHLVGNSKSTTGMDLSPPCQRRLEIDVELPAEELDYLNNKVETLEFMVDDLQSALQKITKALNVYDEESAIQGIMEGSGGAGLFQGLREAIENAAEISTQEKP